MTEDEEEDDEEEEENLRPRRLRRRSSSPEQLRGYRSSVSPSPVKPRNAFDLLGHKPARLKAPQFEKKRLEKNEFIEGEAEESDEDAAFGFGLPKKKDDEEDLDGEDQDRVLEELVDDAHMDDDTLNEEKVMEKVQEHREMDDAADEKIARDAAEGKMRIKRRNNLLDDDDDESDDESWEAKRARERIAKKRRIEGDTLQQIGTYLYVCICRCVAVDVLSQRRTQKPEPSQRRIQSMTMRMSSLISIMRTLHS